MGRKEELCMAKKRLIPFFSKRAEKNDGEDGGGRRGG